MIQTNANAKFSIKFESLCLRVVAGSVVAQFSPPSLAAREIERPPFYSDIMLYDDVVIRLVVASAIGDSAINAFKPNERAVG